VAGLVGLAFAAYYLILDWEGQPICHKAVRTAFKHSMSNNGWDINSGTNEFPNIKGVGVDSLTTISNGMAGHMTWVKDYRYVPGLREDDPGDLVLLYFNRPTRWTWHGPAPTIFEEKAWIVVPVDFVLGPRDRSGPGECSERIPLDQFRTRLRRTLDFVRTNERPHWQTIVADHSKFLDSLERVDR
jgi:hypothetical protein